MKDNIYALFIYHVEKNGYEKWEYRKNIITENPDSYLQGLFTKVFMYKVKGGTCVDCPVKINDVKFEKLYIVYGGGYEMALAKRY